MKPLLIFDFDGTLVDTAPDIISATNALMAELRLPSLSDEHIKLHIGQGLIQLLEDVVPETLTNPPRREALIDRFLAIYAGHYLNTPRLYEGAQEILLNWSNPMAILSNKGSYFLHGLLKHMKLDQLPWVAVIAGDTFSTKKPDPQGLHHILRKAQRSMAQAVMIGDGNPDAELSRSGIRCIACEFGYGAIHELLKLGAEQQLRHYRDLPAVLKTMGF